MSQLESNSVNPKKSWESSPYVVPVFFAIMLLGLVWLFSGFLFSGKILYGSDTIEAGLYHRTMLVDHFKETCSIPKWDPHEFGGLPYIDAFHGDIFYPLSFLKFIIPVYYHTGLILVLHIFLAGIFMFLCAREFGLGKIASLFSAASYMYAGYLVSLVASGHDGNIYSASLFPLVILFIHRAFDSRPFLNFTILGLIIGLIILTPHPRLSYFTLWVAALYTTYKLVRFYLSQRKIPPLIKPAVLAVYAVGLGILLSAIQFLPGYVYSTEYSLRTKKESNWVWATSWSLHEEDVLSQLIPEFSGNTSKLDESNFYWGKNAFKDSTETVGVVSLFLAGLGLFFSRKRERYFFAVLALFAFFYALGGTTPVFKIFYHLIPKVKSLRSPAMIMFIFSFAVALLSGMGLQSIVDRKHNPDSKSDRKFLYYLGALPLLMLALAFMFSFAGRKMIYWWTSVFFKNASTWDVQQGLTKFDIAVLNLPSVQSGAWFAFLFVALAAALIWFFMNKKSSVMLLSALVLIPIADGVRFDSRFISVVEPDDYLKNNNVCDYLLSRPGKFRVFNDDSSFPSSLLHQFGIETVGGYHGNQLRSYDELQKGLQSTAWNNPRFLNFIGAKYLLVPATAPIEENYYGSKLLKIEKTSRYLRIIRNDNALERAYLASSYEVLPDHDEMIQKVLEESVDLRQVVYLEKAPSIEIPKTELKNDSAWIKSYANDSVVVGVNSSHDRILVLMDNFYDSWQAYVDGHPAEIMRAYGSFRAVAIPAGTKEVLFKYESDRYNLGKSITLVASFYLLVVFGVYFWTSRKERLKENGNSKL